MEYAAGGGSLDGVALQSWDRIVQATRVQIAGKDVITGGKSVKTLGFVVGKVHDALRQRPDFLIEQRLAARRGQLVILARNLLGALRDREIDAAAKTIAAETGLAHRSLADGERATGVYRRSVQLASGRFAMLDGMGFSLVP